MELSSTKNIIYQTLIWGFGWLIILMISSESGKIDTDFWRRVLILVSGTSLVVIVNLKWLLPYFFLRKKKILYFILAATILIAIVWGQHSDFLPWNYKPKPEIDGISNNVITGHEEENSRQKNEIRLYWFFRNLPPLLISLLGSSFISISRYSREKEQALIRLEMVNAETELKFLKSQINPHFLFNTLHNIYALTILQPDQVSEKLLKLSNILRYMLYDSNDHKVPLKTEIEYLIDYLDLVKMKDSRGIDVKFESTVRNENILVAPLIFIPFVENAFKHSQFEDLEKGYIHINLNTWKDTIIFNSENSKSHQSYTKDKVGGIGLKNIKQRLNLLYPKKHKLDIEEREDSFKVNLELNCS